MTKKSSTSERRRSSRQTGDAYASLSWGNLRGQDQAFCVVIDVSRHGVRLRTPQPPDAGRMVTVRIALREEVFAISARVIWVKECDRAYDVGLGLHPDLPSHTRFFEAFELAQQALDQDGPPTPEDATPPSAD